MLGYEFTRWWAYRRINDAKMVHYVWTVPLCLTAIGFILYYLLPVKPMIIGNNSLFDKMSLAFTILPGFFISALAAVATFNRSEMDETMPAPAPTALVHHRGNLVEIELTRRIFLSYLFSYLSIISLLLFVACNSMQFLQVNIDYFVGCIPDLLWRSIVDIVYKNTGVAVLLYFSASIFVTMLQGIYFLCERIHMPNS
jgi:hypothetical protein